MREGAAAARQRKIFPRQNAADRTRLRMNVFDLVVHGHTLPGRVDDALLAIDAKTLLRFSQPIKDLFVRICISLECVPGCRCLSGWA